MKKKKGVKIISRGMNNTSAKEAREISKKNKKILTEVAIVEVLPEIEELIKKNKKLSKSTKVLSLTTILAVIWCLVK